MTNLQLIQHKAAIKSNKKLTLKKYRFNLFLQKNILIKEQSKNH
jgi:hypothetical protein